jgi:hypothetical protein
MMREDAATFVLGLVIRAIADTNPGFQVGSRWCRLVGQLDAEIDVDIYLRSPA